MSLCRFSTALSRDSSRPQFCDCTLPATPNIQINSLKALQHSERPPHRTPLEKFNTYIDSWSIARLRITSTCITIIAVVATTLVKTTEDTASPRYIRAWNWDLVPNLASVLVINSVGFLLNESWRAFRGPFEERRSYERFIHKLWLFSFCHIFLNFWVKVVCDRFFSDSPDWSHI
jgi:hypothetical protein